MHRLCWLTFYGLFFVSTWVNAEDSNEQTLVTLHTNLGDIQLALFNQKAPATVDNFLRYVKDGFYNNSAFHRVTPSLIQAGLYDKNYNAKTPNYPAINNEAVHSSGNASGTLAMMHGRDPHSATSQFFINVADNRQRLDYASSTAKGWGYTVFGKVINGMDVVEKIHQSKTGAAGGLKKYAPQAAIFIQSIEINAMASKAVAPTAEPKPTAKPVEAQTPSTDLIQTNQWLPEPPDVPAVE